MDKYIKSDKIKLLNGYGILCDSPHADHADQKRKFECYFKWTIGGILE